MMCRKDCLVVVDYRVDPAELSRLFEHFAVFLRRCFIIFCCEEKFRACLLYTSLLNKPCKTSSDFNERETGAQALNGDENSKWCAESENGEHWLEADIGEVTKIGGWFVMHAGVQESAGYNTSDFRLEYKVNENDEWKCADEVKDCLLYTSTALFHARERISHCSSSQTHTARL